MIKLLNKYKLLCVLILLGITSLLYSTFFRNTEEVIVLKEADQVSPIIEEVTLTDEMVKETAPNKVTVFICGEVQIPGVYEVDATSLIHDVLLKAGGFTGEADQVAINLAQVIIPNEKIYVPKVGEQIDKTFNSYDNVKRDDGIFQVNINDADITELEKLPGIGQVKAEQIISYRNENGLFKSQEELKNVSGIGEKTYEALQKHITIE